MSRRWLRGLLLGWLVLAAASSLRPEAPANGDGNDKEILKKSLLFPGWGQFAAKRPAKGVLFAAGEVFCLVQFVIQNRKANDSYARYRQAQSVDEAVQFRRQTERYDTRRNRFALAGAAVWILNLVDSYCIYRRQTRRKAPPHVQPTLTIHDRETLSLGCRLVF